MIHNKYFEKREKNKQVKVAPFITDPTNIHKKGNKILPKLSLAMKKS